MVIATKVGFRTGVPLVQSGLSRRHIVWSVEQSLKRLGSDWIDVYIVHREDPLTPLEETLGALDEVVRSGKVRYVGFSNWSAWKVAAALEIQSANGLAPFTHGQMYYSLVGRDVGARLRSRCSGATASGSRCGARSRPASSPASTPQSLSRSGQSLLGLRRAAVRQGARVPRRREPARDRGAAPGERPQVAIAWLLAKRA